MALEKKAFGISDDMYKFRNLPACLLFGCETRFSLEERIVMKLFSPFRYAGGLLMAYMVFISFSAPGSIDGPSLQVCEDRKPRKVSLFGCLLSG